MDTALQKLDKLEQQPDIEAYFEQQRTDDPSFWNKCFALALVEKKLSEMRGGYWADSNLKAAFESPINKIKEYVVSANER